MDAGPSTPLQRADGLRISLDSTNSSLVEWPGGSFRGGPHTLPLLQAFAHPRTLAEALEALPLAGAFDWAEAAGTALRMVRAGLLAAPGAEPRTDARGFGRASSHVRMLEDHERTSRFLEAVRRVVRPGDTVLDLGAGTGVLAAAAARAGAHRVYAVEAGDAAEVARRVMQDNGLDHRVEVLRGWSYQVKLPHKVDVVVSEILGSDPLEEGLLPFLEDARTRLARPGAVFIPARVELLVVPVEIPAAEEGRVLARRRLEDWRERYGLDLSAVADWQESAPGRLDALPVERARAFPRCGEPRTLVDLHPGAEDAPPLAGTVDWPHEARALLVCFRAWLAPGIVVSTVPDEVVDTHWLIPLHRVPGQGRVLRWSLEPGRERFERTSVPREPDVRGS